MSLVSKSLVVFVVLLLVLALATTLLRRRRETLATDTSAEIVPSETYLGLRRQILQGLRGKVTLPAASKPTEPYAVLMDWNTGNGIATVVAVADGTASIYLQAGGGSIGGGQSHKEIRDAALKAVSVASALQPQMHLVGAFPLPPRGGVIFYAVADAGVYSSPARAEDLAAHKDPMSRLGDAMQTIVTEYRVLAAGK